MLTRCARALALIALGAALLAAAPAAASADHDRDHDRADDTRYYVALGDSYATGWQLIRRGVGRNTTNAYPNQVVRLARGRGHDLELVNFGCAGATTVSILRTRGCEARSRPVGGPRWTTTQIAAAERFIRAHRGDIGLITVSLGGNDVTQCARPGTDPVTCVTEAVDDIKTNVKTLARRLRAAAGTGVPIVGTTYPDVILGQWTSGRPEDQTLARLSVVAFRSLINPALKESYASARAGFVDVTAATGAYGSLERTTRLAPYGVIPVPVAEVCRLTYYCQYRDIHARTAGYRVIAQLVVRALPRRT